jgi:hypothetical protein
LDGLHHFLHLGHRTHNSFNSTHTINKAFDIIKVELGEEIPPARGRSHCREERILVVRNIRYGMTDTREVATLAVIGLGNILSNTYRFVWIQWVHDPFLMYSMCMAYGWIGRLSRDVNHSPLENFAELK